MTGYTKAGPNPSWTSAFSTVDMRTRRHRMRLMREAKPARSEASGRACGQASTDKQANFWEPKKNSETNKMVLGITEDKLDNPGVIRVKRWGK